MARKGVKATSTAAEAEEQVVVTVAQKASTRKSRSRAIVKEEVVVEEVIVQPALRGTPRKAAVKKAVSEAAANVGSEDAGAQVVTPGKSSKRKLPAPERVQEEETPGKVTEDDEPKKAVKGRGKSTSAKTEVEAEEPSEQEGNAAEEDAVKPPKKKRKTKEEKAAEAMPLAARTAVSGMKRAMFIGAHVSAAGGVNKSIENAMHIGANAFALFLKSQRKWVSPPMASEARDAFKEAAAKEQYDVGAHTLPHGSYLVNLAQIDDEKARQAYDCFVDDLQRCEELGIKLYNFHPGNTGGAPRAEALARIAAQLNRAHAATKSVVTVLENMAGSGNVVGSTFEDLREIIAQVEDKARVGVCLDTCHSFAAGYDLRTPEAFASTMQKFDDVVGMHNLKALHLNDSKAPFESHRDLHANIGTGFLGLRAFHNIMNFAGFQNLPMVLETPIEKKGDDGKAVEDKGIWAREIKLLETLIGRDTETEDFKKEAQSLYDEGESEREKIQKQVDKRVQKTLDSMLKAASPKKKKGKKTASDAGESGEDMGV